MTSSMGYNAAHNTSKCCLLYTEYVHSHMYKITKYMYVTSGSKIKTHYFNSLYFFTFERIFFHLKKESYG